MKGAADRAETAVKSGHQYLENCYQKFRFNENPENIFRTSKKYVLKNVSKV